MSMHPFHFLFGLRVLISGSKNRGLWKKYLANLFRSLSSEYIMKQINKGQSEGKQKARTDTREASLSWQVMNLAPNKIK